MWTQLAPWAVVLSLFSSHVQHQVESDLINGIRAGALAGVSGLPDTTDGIHVSLPMLRCFRQTAPFGGVDSPECADSARHSIATLQGKVDLGWMWTYGHFSAPQLGVKLNLGASLEFDRFPAYAVNPATGQSRPQTLRQWQRAHPSWIEYTCAVNGQGRHTTPAWEYGDVPADPNAPAFVPFDVNNPAARRYMVAHYVLPSLRSGFRSVFFDNFRLHDNAGRCGHYDAAGRWHQDYTTPADPRFEADVLSWLTYIRNEMYAADPGAVLAINYNPAENGDSYVDYEKALRIADVLFEEGGFTYWGEQRMSTQGGLWNREFAVTSWMAAQPGKAVVINGAAGPGGTSPSQVSASERQWVIANYLLVKGDHTYTAILPSTQYGYYVDFPEYHLPIGSPVGAAHVNQGVWMRNFSGGLAVVNPDPAPHAVAIGPGYTDSRGRAVTGEVRLGPTSGVVLLKRRSG